MIQLPPSNACQPRRTHGRRRVRAGVSLLEVMFSIGVVMIGLVGIGALLPLGGALARKGAVADASAQMAANAAREFKARGMAIPNNWRWFDPSASPPQYIAVPVVSGFAPPPGMSFCLDPYFISFADPTRSNYTNEAAARNQFPMNVKYDSGLMAMARITLPSGWTPNGVLAATDAIDRFVSRDDLVFELPNDRTVGPVQNFSFLNGAPAVPIKRNAKGERSWLATIVPKLDRVGSGGAVNVTDEYTLSIVVFDRRPVDRDTVIDSITGNPVTEDDIGERVVMVGTFYSGMPAFSGGDVVLVSRASRGTSGKDDLELRGGDWVMFSGQKTVFDPSAGTTFPVNVHKWYRVVSVGDDPVYNGTVWAREITVLGPDWDTANIAATQVTIVRGVVDVHEKTIRLERSSMWTN